MKYIYGPVPSRRLGRSLGVNNIPPKYCSYACVYCQLGAPQRVTTELQEFYAPVDVASEVLCVLRDDGDENGVDYVTIVPDGEPTLDTNLGSLLQGIGEESDVRCAVITNGSLLFKPEVTAAVAQADWVSVKIDAADEHTWRLIDRPSRSLDYRTVIEGIIEFRRRYQGVFATETMLVKGLNTTTEQVSALARLIAQIAPDIAYLSIPTRPPAESWVEPPDEQEILTAYRTFSDGGIKTELNVTHEEGEFNTGDNVADGILAITSVHPVRRDDMVRLVSKGGNPWSLVDDLISSGQLLEKKYRGETFYLRQLKRSQTR